MALENNQIDYTNTSSDEISLKELIVKIKEWLIFFKTKWRVIFFISFLGACIGLAIAYNDKPQYKALLTFAMEEERGGGQSGAASIASSFGIDLGGGAGGGAFAASNLSELMRSRLIVEKVLLDTIIINGQATSLAEFYIKINDLRKVWQKSPILKSVNFFPIFDRSNLTFQQDSILMQIHSSLIGKEKLSIMQKDKKVTILTIEVNSENELFSKLFCEKLAEATSLFYIETKSKKAKINVDILQSQLDSVKKALNVAINGVAYEVDNNYNLNPAFNIKGTSSKKKQIDVQANTALLTNLAVQLELSKITLRKETPLIQLIDSPILPLQKIKISKPKSLILGGLIGCLLSVFYLFTCQSFKKVLQ
jgi:hypothetical protein